MSPIEILKFPILSPGDISPLKGLRDAGFDPSQIIAVVGKTEGTEHQWAWPLTSVLVTDKRSAFQAMAVSMTSRGLWHPQSGSRKYHQTP